MDPVVPDGEGEGIPLSIRYPKKLLERVDSCAKGTGNNRTETIMHLLRWALTKYEGEREQESRSGKKKGAA